jgi:AbrB family looped-hinge helix DNA binding protein
VTVLVKKLGGSVAVVIPKGVAREMDLAEGTPLEITSNGEAIVMRKQNGRRPRRSMAQIVRGIKTSSYRRRTQEHAERGPVGREIW